jgi:NADPH:quinone reductase-like Zn-dependent oxidoreductase
LLALRAPKTNGYNHRITLLEYAMNTWSIPEFGLEKLQRVQRPIPDPGHGEVVVRIRAVSLNYRDLLIVKGQYNPRMKLPCVPGSDGAGEVIAIGPNVSRTRVGERVCGQFMPRWLSGPISDAVARPTFGADIDGVLAEHVVFPQESVVPVPAHLSFEEAATLPCAAVTAWNALLEGGLKAGDSVLVQGTGGVSLFALQFAKLAGAKVLVTSGNDDKLQRALSMGASAGVNYRTNPEWDKWAKSQTGGVGVDHIVEVGGAGTLERSFQAVRTGGQIAVIGILAGGNQINPMPIIMRALKVRGIFVGSRQMFEDMNRAIELHQMHPVVDRTFAFEEFPDALRYLESAAHFGKIVVQV